MQSIPNYYNTSHKMNQDWGDGVRRYLSLKNMQMDRQESKMAITPTIGPALWKHMGESSKFLKS